MSKIKLSQAQKRMMGKMSHERWMTMSDIYLTHPIGGKQITLDSLVESGHVITRKFFEHNFAYKLAEEYKLDKES